MIIKKGAQVWYWDGATSVPAVITRVANAGTGGLATLRGVTLDLSVAGKTLRAVPLVIGAPTPEQLAGALCTTRQYTPPPKPLTFEQALAQVKAGKTATRPGGKLTPADVAASDWAVA